MAVGGGWRDSWVFFFAYGVGGFEEAEEVRGGVLPRGGFPIPGLARKCAHNPGGVFAGRIQMGVFPGGARIRIIDRSFPCSFVSPRHSIHSRLFRFLASLASYFQTRNVYPHQAPPLQTSVFARLPTRSRPSYLHTPRAKEARRPR